MTVYIFLPSGTEAREMDRPFSNIRTSTILHTPKVALSHLSTQFAPIMLQGQFNTTLQVSPTISPCYTKGLDFLQHRSIQGTDLYFEELSEQQKLSLPSNWLFLLRSASLSRL